MAFYPSPLKDDGHDVVAYYSINRMYGTLRDFCVFRLGAVYLQAYRGVVGQRDLLPHADDPLGVLLEAHLLEKAVYELGSEPNHRADWVEVPLRGSHPLLESGKTP
jgi:predicted trehalose synthase